MKPYQKEVNDSYNVGLEYYYDCIMVFLEKSHLELKIDDRSLGKAIMSCRRMTLLKLLSSIRRTKRPKEIKPRLNLLLLVVIELKMPLLLLAYPWLSLVSRFSFLILSQ